MTSKADTALTERNGVLAVATIFNNQFGWFFREQTQLDWGIDAHVEQVEGDQPTGRLFALQIKSGASYFRSRGNDFIYYGDLKHLDYWSDHSLPVYIILHNPDTGLTIWQKITRHCCVITKKKWSIIIPACNVLDEKAKHYFESGLNRDEVGSRRLRFAIDSTLMEHIGNNEVYFIWEDWVNKGLGLRNLRIFIAEYDGRNDRAPDVDYDMWSLPTHNVALAMSIFFPWLEYEYAEDVEEDSECELHVLAGRLTPAALGYLEAERFFLEGTDWRGPEAPYATNGYDEFQRALERDWENEWSEREET